MPRGVSPLDEAQIQGRLWTPALLRIALWLDAADLSTISVTTGVSTWRDKSGNQRHFTQGTGGTQPTLTPNGLNGRNVLSFNGSQWLTSVNTAATWNFLHNANGSSVFAVWKAGNVANPNTLYGLMGTNAVASVNAGVALIYDDRSSSSRNDRVICTIERAIAGGSTVANLSADNAHPSNTPVILSHIGDPNNAIAANRSSILVNRGAAIRLNTFTLAPSASNASFTLQIGACGNNQIPMVGYVAEIVILDFIVNDRVRQVIEGYLAWKWGLRDALTTGSPFLNRPPLIGD
jgi:hypothetical protein